ncbi:hypothetical protein T4A_9626 [Trichinella pseudospiralis]|nr:hypothetical protein T4A_9626 [Trichinella pseudospiralis]KRY78796.1 hypothetical protein T4A_9626 [Trichinella pseudospiralis]KRZ46036.1 hypothetical protein T4C_11378 [Trichinella pseudospiralis]
MELFFFFTFIFLVVDIRGILFGKIGYECIDQKVCTDEHSECRFGRCYCKSGYDYSYKEAHIACVILPKLGQQCEIEHDSRHQSCADPHAVCSGGLCKCKDSYIEQNNRCVVDVKTLHENCISNHQCITPFSYCNDENKCVCRTKFSEINGECHPTKYNCLEGEPILKNSQPINCSIVGRQHFHCPEQSYCVPFDEHEGQWSCQQVAVFQGICCPVPKREITLKPSCLVGKAHSTPDSCPINTHIRHKDRFIPWQDRPCCPRACPYGYGKFGNKCYQINLLPGDLCEHDGQCACGFCTANSQGEMACQCQPGFTELYGKCHDERCFHGDPAIDTDTGAIVECSSKNEWKCPEDYSCISEFGLCCPKIPIYT